MCVAPTTTVVLHAKAMPAGVLTGASFELGVKLNLPPPSFCRRIVYRIFLTASKAARLQTLTSQPWLHHHITLLTSSFITKLLFSGFQQQLPHWMKPKGGGGSFIHIKSSCYGLNHLMFVHSTPLNFYSFCNYSCGEN